MIRPLVLTPLLSFLVCACGHASTSHQQNSAQVAQQAAPTAQQRSAGSAPQPGTAATPQNEAEQAAADARSEEHTSELQSP